MKTITNWTEVIKMDKTELLNAYQDVYGEEGKDVF